MTGVVSGFGRIVTYAFNGLDMSSAANDTIVVQHRDGTLHSSPFNVRFGKFKVLRPQDKVVSIEVNGVLTKAVMKINSDGEAFWLEPTDAADVGDRAESPVQPLTSPLMTQRSASPGLPSLTLATPASPQSPAKRRSDLSDEGEAAGSRAASVPGAHADEVVVVDPVHLTVDHAHVPTNASALENTSGNMLDAINAVGDDELQTVLGPQGTTTAQETPSASAAAATIPAVSKGDAPAPPAVDTTPNASTIFAQEMSVTERQKYDELLRSISEGAKRDGTWNGITLSKLASYDDLSAGAAVETPMTAPQGGSVAIPEHPGDTAALEVAAADNNSTAPTEDVDEENDEEEVDDDDEDGAPRIRRGSSADEEDGDAPARVYYKPTTTPMSVDLIKLGLQPGRNRVRYMTHTSLQGRVVVESSIYLWSSDAKIVVSDIDGTVTKSDVWGHILPMIGRDWTHPGICSLYSKVAKNGYEFVYLTARSMSQQEQTRKFLWQIEQDGMALPRGPVMTAPDRFFTALTQEVSKKAHEFKIACLRGIQRAFPKQCRPFYAGFGNRIGDVVSYTATQIPKHKIFIIDTNSTLHVCRVTQTYKNLAHLVDVTFPPLKPTVAVACQPPRNPLSTEGLSSPGGSAPSSASSSPTLAAASAQPSIVPFGKPVSLPSAASMEEGDAVDADFNSFNFWRVLPEELVDAPPPQAKGEVPQIKKHSGTSQLSHPSFVDTLPRSDAPSSPQAQSQPPGNKSWFPRWLKGSQPQQGNPPPATSSASLAQVEGTKR